MGVTHIWDLMLGPTKGGWHRNVYLLCVLSSFKGTLSRHFPTDSLTPTQSRFCLFHSLSHLVLCSLQIGCVSVIYVCLGLVIPACVCLCASASFLSLSSCLCAVSPCIYLSNAVCL
eukprot:GHVN01036576.1.p1 GENE.GHVN01036576.1~~GHVN01036576.1.p1  ORF type:complete len:116 (+),score=5.74 GHVN01036576.1:14-361(+)